MLGITNSHQAMTGYQLEHMDDGELAKTAVEYDIFCSYQSGHKLRLVKAKQDTGEVVGMTGDGGERCASAPPADVSIAMGIKGTRSHQRGGRHGADGRQLRHHCQLGERGRRVYDNLKKRFCLYAHQPARRGC